MDSSLDQILLGSVLFAIAKELLSKSIKCCALADRGFVVTAAESNLFHGTLVVFPPTGGTYTTQCIDSPVPSTGTKMFED